MSESKVCPIAHEACDPASEGGKVNVHCTFLVSDPFSSRCLYMDGMKALPQIADAIRKLKLQN